MPLDQLLLFVVAGLLLNLTPGPDVLYIVTQALRSGRRAGIVAALGITAGCFVHILAAAVGVSALFAASAGAFAILKWAGALYLVYIGTRLLLTPGSAPAMDGATARQPVPARLRQVFLQGFMTNALNPKVALFFLAFVPQFIGPEVEHKAMAFVLLGLLFNLNGLFVNIGWALGASTLATRAGGVRRVMPWLDKAAGAMFIGFGIKLALTDNPSR